MKWQRDPVIYPAIYHSEDGRFQVTRTYGRKGLRRTYSRIELLDKNTGEEFAGFRSLREAKAGATALSIAGRLRERLIAA